MLELWLLYSLKSAFVLSLLYVPYMLMLQKESFFKTNRVVLLLIILLSLMLPLIDVHFLAFEYQPVAQNIRLQMIGGGFPRIDETMVSAVGIEQSEAVATWSWFYIASVIFVVGLVLNVMWRLLQMLRMHGVIKGGSLWHQNEKGIHIYCHADDVSPFSWMHSIVIGEKDYKECSREILLHEEGHVRAGHSWDLIFLSVLQSVQWWNPLAYVLELSLRAVHEYEADDFVLRNGVSARAYQLLLIRKVVGSNSYTFANNFEHRLTFKRITMMQKTKSNKWMRSKVLYIVPMATLALSAFATSENLVPSVQVQTEDKGKVMKTMPRKQARKIEDLQLVFSQLKASDTTIVYLLDGRMVSVDELQTVAQEDIVSIAVIKDDEAAAHMGHAGKEVLVVKTVKGSEKDVAPQEYAKVNYVKLPAFLPEFKGGMSELMKFLQTHMRYPVKALDYGVEGKVFVQFFVTELGDVVHVRPIALDKYKPTEDLTLPEVVVKAYAKNMMEQGKELTAEEKAGYEEGVKAILEEAARVIKIMPRWEPGYADKEKKEPCTTCFTCPINFRLR